MKGVILWTFICFLAMPISSATVVSFSFNDIFQSDSQEWPGLIYAHDTVFEITTPNQNALCRYSSSPGVTFDSMTEGFEGALEIIHKKTLTNLHDGVYRYYIRCREMGQLSNQSQGLAVLETVFRISQPIAAQITMDETVLRTGTYNIELTTTKVPITTPSLEYTYDGSSYRSVVLHGSGTQWKGSITIPNSEIEAMGRFRFEARDLENRIGNRITGEDSFMVDTIAPKIPSAVEATGEYGRILLEWYNDDSDVETVRIYRTLNPPVKITSLYHKEDLENDYFVDDEVKNGQTYYYRIAFEDAAGNVGELSQEFSATVLMGNSSSTTSSVLSAELVGAVDTLLTEIELTRNEITRVQAEFSSLEGSQKEYVTLLGILDGITSSKASIDALKREVEGFKLQNIQKNVLDTKLDSARSRLGVLRKAIPDSFQISQPLEKSESLTEENMRAALLKSKPELLPEIIESSSKASVDQAIKFETKIRTTATTIEVIYLDGSKTSNTVIEHTTQNAEGLNPESEFIVTLPQGLLSTARIKMITAEYTEEREDVFRFSGEVSKISYQFDERVSLDEFNAIRIVPLLIVGEESFITGYFLSKLPGTESIGVVFLIIVASSLGVYLLYVRNRKKEDPLDPVSVFIQKARRVKELRREGKIEESNSLYTRLKADYLALSSNEKVRVFKEVKHLAK